MRGKTVIVAAIMALPALTAHAQGNDANLKDYESFYLLVNDTDENMHTLMVEMQNILDEWLEYPLCINNEDVKLLAENQIITDYQLSKLLEYRYMYGDLLSIWELYFIEGWHDYLIRLIAHLVTINSSETEIKGNGKPSSIRQSLIVKTSWQTNKSKGYSLETTENEVKAKHYEGSPIKIAFRYDFSYNDRIDIGLRMEKDPGEPFLVSSRSLHKGTGVPDMMSGFLRILKLGPIRQIVAGDFRVKFGYGLNITGSQPMPGRADNFKSLACQVKPQTSTSESGYFRGIAFNSQWGSFHFAGFASYRGLDGSSIKTDSSGKVISFSSISTSGLHRTISELANRKAIREMALGGWLVYQNKFIKTGIVAFYNQYDAEVIPNGRPYTKFSFSGSKNLVCGIANTIMLKKISFFSEASVCRSGGAALLAGIRLIPVTGSAFAISYYHFDNDYQNWNGSGVSSSGNNAGETGIKFNTSLELKNWLLILVVDRYMSQWSSHDVNAPSEKSEYFLALERQWQRSCLVRCSFRYTGGQLKDGGNSYWICHPTDISHYYFRMEGQYKINDQFRAKSRFEGHIAGHSRPGWLIFQDIEYSPGMTIESLWLRIATFDVQDYESRLYAYENDVLYDFTSFVHNGKGIRGVFMARVNPWPWINLWLRLSTVYYTNKKTGSGWDEVDSNRQNEVELQVKIRLPYQ